MLFLYDLIYLMAFIIYTPVMVVRGKWHSRMSQRWGNFSAEHRWALSMKPNIWFHAVSVGEVLSVAHLIESMKKEQEDQQIVLTTVTMTGYDIACKRLGSKCIILYAPLDLSWIVAKFIKLIDPVLFVTVETELWPNLLWALARRDIPMAMINGRISDRSFLRYKRFGFLFARQLKRFRLFCMQTSLDADRVLRLGAKPSRVKVMGSMKFDEASGAASLKPAYLGLSPQSRVLVAGSTHAGEEKILLEIYSQLREQVENLVLLLAPRHIERSGTVYQIAQDLGLKTVYYTKLVGQENIQPQVIIIDAIGYLKSLYAIAEIVFVGKSLTGIGGQNIIEPAVWGKPIIVGPHMENFKEICEIFIHSQAIVQVEDAKELKAQIELLLRNPALRQSLSHRAKETIKKYEGASERTFKELKRLLKESQFINFSC